jgi:hypothetical protein
MRVRFSKALLEAALLRRIGHLEAEYLEAAGKRIDRRNGTSQIPKGNTEAAFVYGKLMSIETLFDEFDL